MGKNNITTYKCNNFYHTLGTLPNKDSDYKWNNEFKKIEKQYIENKTDKIISDYYEILRFKPKYKYLWQEYWHEKVTKKGNYIYRCKACLYINNRNKKYNEKNLPEDYVSFRLMGKHLSPKEIEKIPKSLIEIKREVLKLKYLIKNPIIKCIKHGNLFIYDKKLVKSGKEKDGRQKYRCKECLKESHKKNYIKNKVKILNRCRENKLRKTKCQKLLTL